MSPSPVRRSTTSLFGAATAAGALLLASACGGGGGEEPAGGAGGGDSTTIEHAMGETVIESEPSTVVVLDTSYLDSAIALERDVVRRTDYAGGGGLRDYLGEEGKTYAGGAEVVGSLEAPDLAKIAELQPDLILSAKVRHEDVYDQLAKIAPTVFSETTGATWQENHRLVGEAVGNAELGEDIAEANGGEAPTMTLARFAGELTVRLYGAESFPGIIQSDVGLPAPKDAPKPPEGEIMVPLGPEEILDLDADHIYVSTWDDGTGDSADKAEEFTGNPLWDQLEGEKHEVDDNVWVSSVSLQGAHAVRDEMAEVYGV